MNTKLNSNIKADDSAEASESQSLDYIFDVLLQLVKIAKKADEASLVYYLEMAALEAGERSTEKTAAKQPAPGK